METLLISVAIFVARLADQSIGTMRIIFLMRGRRAISGILGFFESGIWLLAVSQVVTNVDEPIKVIAFAGGFGAGTALGGTVERWLAIGQGVLRVVSPFDTPQAAAALRQAGFAVSVINGEGRNGPVRLAFSVVPRKRKYEALDIVRAVNPEAFVTFEDVETPSLAARRVSWVRK
ncbi:MAG: DUF2179 domain-containing protein [Acidimicrobiia bacterium]|nr:DUF2179 domain-containing protein [Acidimicrobiia bacterium]MBT8215765.1 DUF2179 domain-containing protein [Acidimicrobiia bacterium]